MFNNSVSRLFVTSVFSLFSLRYCSILSRLALISELSGNAFSNLPIITSSLLLISLPIDSMFLRISSNASSFSPVVPSILSSLAKISLSVRLLSLSISIWSPCCSINVFSNSFSCSMYIFNCSVEPACPFFIALRISVN